jgi:hypothetical protein
MEQAMAADWFWGDVPEGFEKVQRAARRVIVVRAGAAGDDELENLFMDGSAGGEESRYHGRAKLAHLRLNDGTSALVRRYRHGGVLRRFTGGVFCTWPPRPFRELAITEAARRAGLPTVEVLAACVERIWGPFYRGCLVTRELAGARDLWAALQDDSFGRRSVLEAVARSVRHMHRRGIYHGDLNLKNILVAREGARLQSYIIDFDKARLFAGEVPAAKAERNLARLLRSICKLDAQRRYLSAADWDDLVGFYRDAAR